MYCTLIAIGKHHVSNYEKRYNEFDRKYPIERLEEDEATTYMDLEARE